MCHFVQDENVQSDDDDDDNDFDGDMNKVEETHGKRKNLGQLDDDDVEEEDDERHLRMLQGITGMPTEAFDGIVLLFLNISNSETNIFKHTDILYCLSEIVNCKQTI